ncbi:MAG: hypothetical protein JW982_08710 [Spirochaetes bacterium]|nr:hypothetical protein [Spirochaetota bacterium]
MLSFLRKTPFLSFWPDDALLKILSSSEEIFIPESGIFNADSDKDIFVIKNGFLVNLDNLDKKQGSYFITGSFFGALPFVESRNRMKLSAVENTVILRVDHSVLLQIFIEDVKLYKAYSNFLNRTSIDIKKGYQAFADLKNRIISVSSSEKCSGKSMVASMLGSCISSSHETLLLDLSYNGISLFEYFDIRISPPLAEKEETEDKIDLSSKIVRIREGLSILNMTNTSKINMDADVLSHVLFKLSSQYGCIVMDVDSDYPQLQQKAFSLSDAVVLVSAKKRDSNYLLADLYCNRGQDIFQINNSHFSRKTDIDGLLDLEDFKIINNKFSPMVTADRENGIMSKIRDVIFKSKNILLLGNSGYATSFYTGLFRKLFNEEAEYDYIAADFLSAVNALFFLKSDNYAQYLKSVKDFFRIEKLKVLAEVSYPDNYIYSIDKFEKYFSGIFSSERLEFHDMKLLSCLKNRNSEAVIKTSGLFSKIAAANISMDPFFEKADISGLMLSNSFDGINIDRWHDYIHVEKITGIDIHVSGNTPGDGLLDKIFMNTRYYGNSGSKNEVFEVTGENLDMKISDIIDFSENLWPVSSDKS